MWLGQVCPAWTQSRLTRNLPDSLVPLRLLIVGGSSLAGYGSSLIILNRYWYKNYPRTHFHFFNDDPEWLQMDKAGHAFTAYTLGKLAANAWQWTGAGTEKSVWIGGMSGFAYQTIVELLDAYSSKWGFSKGDMAADMLGTAMFMTQEFLWKEQRITMKFSAHPVHYGNDPTLEMHTRALFGDAFLERIIKDYNGQTYWMSANIDAFFKGALPQWLNMAVGYGAENMYAGRGNWWEGKDGIFYDYKQIPRIRRFFLAPDIDLTRIPVNGKVMRTILQIFNMIKIPAPALEINGRGKIKLHALYF